MGDGVVEGGPARPRPSIEPARSPSRLACALPPSAVCTGVTACTGGGDIGDGSGSRFSSCPSCCLPLWHLPLWQGLQGGYGQAPVLSPARCRRPPPSPAAPSTPTPSAACPSLHRRPPSRWPSAWGGAAGDGGGAHASQNDHKSRAAHAIWTTPLPTHPSLTLCLSLALLSLSLARPPWGSWRSSGSGRRDDPLDDPHGSSSLESNGMRAWLKLQIWTAPMMRSGRPP
jgi:hypothetical protein